MPIQNCPIDIPEGYEFVAHRQPDKGENFISSGDMILTARHNYISPQIVVRPVLPPLQVGDVVRIGNASVGPHAVRLGRVAVVSGNFAHLNKIRGASSGKYHRNDLVKQQPTISRYTLDECIAQAARRGRHVLMGPKSTIIQDFHPAGVTLACPSIGFVSYEEASRSLKWASGDAFGVVKWEDAE